MSAVLQLVQLGESGLATSAAPMADALWNAGLAVAAVARGGGLSADHVIRWPHASFDNEQLNALWRRIMDPAVRFHVPVFMAGFGGWLIQISCRLIWVTNESVDQGASSSFCSTRPRRRGCSFRSSPLSRS